jgi:NtrC-family two-component system sensor histidine kinase KinB
MRSLRAKILLGYGLALVLVATVLAWAFYNLRLLGMASGAILSENYKSILAAGNMIEAIEQQDSALLLLLLGYRQEGITLFAAQESRFLPWLGRARDNITIEGESEIVAAIDRRYQEYLQEYPQLTGLNERSPAQARQYYQDRILAASSAVREAAGRLRELNQETMFAASDRAERISARAAASMAGVGGASLVLGLSFSLVLSSWITRPVRRLGEAIRKIADGSYEVQLHAGSSDELGRLAESFNAMVARLRSYHRMNIGKIVEEKRKNDALIRSIDDGILLINDQLLVTNMNPAAERLFALTFQEDAPRHFLELLGDPQLVSLVREALQSGQVPALEGREHTLRIEREGGDRYFQCSLTPVLSAERKRLGVVLLLRDVTRLKEIDRLKDEFLMTASHELRTPLTGIAMSIGLLQESLAGKLDGRDKQLLEVAGAEVARLRSLVSDLLDLSKIESGNIALEIEAVPAETLVEKACAVFRTLAAEKSIQLRCQTEQSAGRVSADANKVGWALTNLIANALRYTVAGGHIEVAARRAGSFVYFSVADDGAGIPPESQSRIFDKFFTVKSENREAGTGLGLAICREIVRAHGGTIWVDSEPAKGSVFTFTIPVERRYDKKST